MQIATCIIAAGASAQYLNYPAQSKPLATPQLSAPHLKAGVLSQYLPLIQKYVPGASLFLPTTTTTTPAPSSPAAPPISLTQQQLPKLETAQSFYSDQPSTVLKPPQGYNAAPNTKYYDVPVPSQELQAPSQLQWNPENDPRFYFNNPSIPGEIPTSLHPKKYDKQLHATAKPYAKNSKRRKSEKARQNLVVPDNQKRVKAEKVQQKKSIRNKANDQQLHPALKNEPQTAESGYLPGFDTHSGYVGPYETHSGYHDAHAGYHHPTGYADGGATHANYGHHSGYSDGGSTAHAAGYGSHHPTSAGYSSAGPTHAGYGHHANAGYSDGGATHPGYDHHPSGFTDGGSDLRAAVNSEGHHPHHPPKERLEFQLHGHDGPNSYKWGFDHGEG